MFAEVLTGFQERGNPGYALTGLLALLITIFSLGLAGSHWLSTWNVPAWLSWLR
jgi:hypothetical protein